MECRYYNEITDINNWKNNAREGTKPEIIGQQKKKTFFKKLMKPDETPHDSLTSFSASKNEKRDTGTINRNNLEQFLSVTKRLS